MDQDSRKTNPTYDELESTVALLAAKLKNLVSYQEDLKLKENIFQEVLDAVPSFIFWKDSNNNMLGFNRAYQQAVNIPREELLSKTGFELFPDAEKYWIDDKQVIDSGQPKLNIEEEVVIPPGKTIWFKTDKVPLKDASGRAFGVIGVSIDITQIKEYQVRLEKSLEENERANKALETAKNVAEKANQAKSDFLASMSHELRTPLNAIMGFSETLMAINKDPVQSSYIKTIYSSGQTLLFLINDLLDLSKIEAGHMEIAHTPFDIYNLCEEINYLFQPATKTKDLKLDFVLGDTLPKTLLLDQVRVKQVLVNLVGNAVKFTSAGKVTVSLHGKINEAEKSVNLSIDVTDTGIGIAQEDIAMIFAKFTQAKTIDKRKYGGTGLGLSITKRLVELMGGTIHVKSQPGQGSSFVVDIPDVKYEDRELTTQSAIDWTQKKVRFFSPVLLVVDDVKTNRELIRVYLAENDINILEASSASEAYLHCREKNIDLILMDLRMPGIDGYQAAKQIKEEFGLKTPVIAFTASHMNHEKTPILNLFDGLLKKPVTRLEILKMVMNWLPHQVEDNQEAPDHKFENDASQIQVNRLGKSISKYREILQDFAARSRNMSAVVDLDAIGDFIQDVELFMEQQQLQFFLQDYVKLLCLAHTSHNFKQLRKLLVHFPTENKANS